MVYTQELIALPYTCSSSSKLFEMTRSPGREFNLIDDVETNIMYEPEITLLPRPS